MRTSYDDEPCFRAHVEAWTRLPLASARSSAVGASFTGTRSSWKSSAATTRARAEAHGCSSDAASSRAFFDGVDRDHYER